MNPNETQLDDLFRVRTFVARYPEAGTEHSLRYQIHNCANNGLLESGAIIKNGHRVLIDAPKYLKWLLGGRITGDASTMEAASARE